jgi:flagella basal body P-ring formation protein FlgA
MKALVMIAWLALQASTASAESVAVETIVRNQVTQSLPVDLGVTHVFLPASLATLAIDPSKVTVELPRELRAGRSTIKVAVRGRATVFVPVAIGKLVDVAIAKRALPAGTVIEADDITIERRSVELAPASVGALVGATVTTALAANEPIAARSVALPPPLSRGTRVTIEMRRGAIVVRGTATLEVAARPGEAASARLAHTKTVVRGTLRAPATLVVEETL